MASRQFKPEAALALIVALFVFAVLFVIPGFSKYHGDERFYTDAALQMRSSGDYWTPHYPNGKIRLLKPILTYWGVVTSFNVFGVSLAASRLPSLCAGVFSLITVFFLGKSIFRSAVLGVLAAALLASNIEFLTLSARATPDALVTLFSLLSMLGFSMVWFGETRSWLGPLLAWGGAGLAVQTKGLLGLCPVLVNLLFVALARPDDWRLRIRALLDWRGLLAGVCLAGFWYVAMIRIHGAGALRDFFDDQVGAKVTISPGFILHNFVTYFTAGLRHFLPWTLLLAAGLVHWRKPLSDFWAANKRRCVFLLVLFPLLVLVFSFGNMRTSRYVMLSYPALAVLIAALVHTFWDAPRLQRFLRSVLLVLGISLLVVAVGLLAAGVVFSWRLAVAGLLVAAAGFSGILLRRVEAPLGRWLWIAALGIIFYAVFDGGIRPVSTPTPFAAIVRDFEALTPTDRTVLTYKVDETAASQLRLAAHGRIQVRVIDKADIEQAGHIVLTTGSAKNDAQLYAYEFKAITLDRRFIELRDAFKKFRRRDPGRNTAGRNFEYFLGIPMVYTNAPLL